MNIPSRRNILPVVLDRVTRTSLVARVHTCTHTRIHTRMQRRFGSDDASRHMETGILRLKEEVDVLRILNLLSPSVHIENVSDDHSGV